MLYHTKDFQGFFSTYNLFSKSLGKFMLLINWYLFSLEQFSIYSTNLAYPINTASKVKFLLVNRRYKLLICFNFIFQDFYLRNLYSICGNLNSSRAWMFERKTLLWEKRKFWEKVSCFLSKKVSVLSIQQENPWILSRMINEIWSMLWNNTGLLILTKSGSFSSLFAR